MKQPGRAVRAFAREVEAAGGSVGWSHDGHLKVYDRAGRFVVKLRTAGKKVGDGSGGTGRNVYAGVLRRVVRG